MVVSTYGGGIYQTFDQGENWSELAGTLPNLFVNKIEYGGGQFDPIGVATEGGPFIWVNGVYIDCNGTGLTNTSINFWSATDEGMPLVKDAIAGTKGDGIFAADYTTPFIYDWSPASSGLTGDALFINDGFAGVQLAVLATEGGIYRVQGGETEWSAVNDGLTGSALNANDIYWFGFYMLATDGGLYYVINLGDTWTQVIPDEKLNIVFFVDTDISPTEMIVYALGENGFYSYDFETWTQMDFGGIQGEVTAAQADSTNLYIGFTIDGKDGKESGGIYRKPLEQFITGIEYNFGVSTKAQLKQNYPNPFSGTTKINYSISNSGFVSLKVYDVFGREIQTLANEFQTIGTYTIPFDASHLDEGIYFYSLQVGNNAVETRRMILIDRW